MPRPALLSAALVLTALPVLAAGPAHAAGGVYCVNMGADCPAGGVPVGSIQEAATKPDVTTIRVGPGRYTEAQPYAIGPGVTIQGSGAGTGTSSTVLTLPASATAQPYLTAGANATVRSLRVEMGGTGSAGDIGLSLNGAIVRNVVVIGAAGTTGAYGVEATNARVEDATVNLTQAAGNTGVHAKGGNTFLDSTWNAETAYRQDVAATDTVSRVTFRGTLTGASVEAGTLLIDNSLFDLGTTGTSGLAAAPVGSAATATVDAKQLTVVGGAATSRGVWANASRSGVTHTATMTLANSVVRGPENSVDRRPGASGTANLSVRNTAIDNPGLPAMTDDGGGNLVSLTDPGFIYGAGGNYALRTGAAVVDKGAANVVTPADITGGFRSFDGDRNGSPIPDMGAYELTDIKPAQTTFTSGPNGPTKNSTPVFQFKTNEPGATMECRVDGGAWLSKCTSPATTNPLSDGPHTFEVRSIDKALNVEDPPALRSFVVDTASPNTTITKKPPKRFTKKRVKFKFVVSEPGAKLQCNLDRRGWKACQPTYRFNVKVGKHQLQVRAVDAAGNADPTPARYSYRRVKPRR